MSLGCFNPPSRGIVDYAESISLRTVSVTRTSMKGKTMTPTVDLLIDKKTDEQTIEVVFGNRRFPLAPWQAARLSADLSTILAFAINPDSVEETRPAPKTRQAQPEQNTDQPLAWHRVATGKYRTKWLSTTVETFKGDSGWNVKIGGKIVNDGPLASKRAAVELVEGMRVSA